MMKRIALVLAFFLLLTACSVAFMACNGSGDGRESEESTSGETTDEVTTGEVTTDEVTTDEATTDGEATTVDDGEGSESPQKMDLANMDLSPYITLGQYKNVPVVQKEMEYLISMNVLLYGEGYFDEITEGDRKVKEGDIINVDYKGYLDGVAFEGGEAAKQIVTVYEGTGYYIDGFASGFIGAKAGESSEFDVTFPKNYDAEELAGKAVTFEFTVNAIYEFGALTDEIASELSDGAYPTAKEYEEYRRNLMVQSVLWTTIVENATVIEYPEQQVEYYYQQNRSYYELYAAYYGMEYEEFLQYYGLTDEDLYENAKLYVLEDLVYNGILQAEGIVLTEEDYNKKLDSYIQRFKDEYGYTDEQIEENMELILDNMLYDKVQELLIEWADVTWE